MIKNRGLRMNMENLNANREKYEHLVLSPKMDFVGQTKPYEI